MLFLRVYFLPGINVALKQQQSFLEFGYNSLWTSDLIRTGTLQNLFRVIVH